MAPGQAPHQPIPWRDAHPFLLLSPLVGLLSRAWSRLRGPGPPEPWLVEAVTSADQGEAGLEGETKAALAAHYAPWGGHPQGKAGDSAAREENEASWGPCPDRKAYGSFEAWGLSDDDDDDDDEEYGWEEATSVLRDQGSEYIGGQPAPLSPSLLIRTLKDPSGEEESEEVVVAEDKVITFSLPPSHWECCPGVAVEEEDAEAINKAALRKSSTSPLSPGSKPRAWLHCAGEKERTENKGRKTSVSSSSAASHPSTWECCSGEAAEEDTKTEKEADPGPHPVLAQRPLLGAWQHQPSKITEDGENEDIAPGEAEGPSSIAPRSAFFRAWVYQPGEDTEEEEEEDGDSGEAEEEGEAEGPSSIQPTSAFLRTWVYRPGEDTEEEDEDSDSGVAEEEEAKDPSGLCINCSLDPTGGVAPQNGGGADGRGGPGGLRFLSVRDEGAGSWDSWAHVCYRGLRVNSPGKAVFTVMQHFVRGWAPMGGGSSYDSCQPQKTSATFSESDGQSSDRWVRFSEKVSIHLLAVWAGPAQAARRGPWEQFARDRSRFARRIAQAQEVLGPCLTPAARARAWARLGNPPPSLATIPAPTQTLPTSFVQATPLSHAVASPSPLYVSPCLDLSGRRG
ncbi:Protein phosphatase 1 regulatory subunit 15A [Pteropus alecto]|uniref:Protein phosphatase 1 regulatory subunit 15A n=1 Tax=Pteropus alecto TaxID=9402 RepID=L5L4K0_PTEAL|nr:Protein phosphatase 1 regulatory subunit 15A [Pteropus alecto]